MHWVKLPSGKLINVEHLLFLRAEEHAAAWGGGVHHNARTSYTAYCVGDNISLDEDDYGALVAYIESLATVVEAK